MCSYLFFVCVFFICFCFLFELHFVSFPCLHWHLFPLVEQMQMRYVASGQVNDAEGKRQIRKGFFGLE